jgi:hypothetical protein
MVGGDAGRWCSLAGPAAGPAAAAAAAAAAGPAAAAAAAAWATRLICTAIICMTNFMPWE